MNSSITFASTSDTTQTLTAYPGYLNTLPFPSKRQRPPSKALRMSARYRHSTSRTVTQSMYKAGQSTATRPRDRPVCSACQRDFFDFADLHHHEKKYQRVCPSPGCQRVAVCCVSGKELFQHVQKHHPELLCGHCRTYFTSSKSKLEHDRENHLVCPKCPGKSFDDEYSRIEHYETSSAHEKTYCRICSLDFNAQLDLLRHEFQQHPHIIESDFPSDLMSGLSDLSLSDASTRGNGSRYFGDDYQYGNDSIFGERTERRDTRDSYMSRTRSLRTNGRQPPRDSKPLPSLLQVPKVDSSKYTKPPMPTLPSTPQHPLSGSRKGHDTGASYRPRESERHPRQEHGTTAQRIPSSKHRPTTVKEGMDLYLILKISPSASQSEIEKAVKKMRIQYHPDKRKRPDMSSKESRCIDEQAKLVGEAAEVLLDPEKRRCYDRKGRC